MAEWMVAQMDVRSVELMAKLMVVTMVGCLGMKMAVRTADW